MQSLEGDISESRSSTAAQGEQRFAFLAVIEEQPNPKLALWGVCAGFWLLFEVCVAYLAWTLGSSAQQQGPTPAATPRRRARRKAPVKKEPSQKLPAQGGLLIPPAAPEKATPRKYGGRSIRPEDN